MTRFQRIAVHSLAYLKAWPVLSSLAVNSLRILLYHRVCDPDSPAFFGYKSIVSARPADFAGQMDYLLKYYRPISLDDCLAWIYAGKSLPKRAILITFDDGYRDNLTYAMPALAARGIPFVLFVATGHIDDTRIFFWDWVAEAFRHSPVRSARLPVIGEFSWTDEETDAMAQRWIRAVAPLSERGREASVAELSHVLQYCLYDAPPPGTYCSWSDLVEMRKNGCSIGAHSVSHPMFVGLPVEQAAIEMALSKAAIEEKLNAPVLSFAFPFGHTTEYETRYLSLLAETGFKLAFRSTGGINFANDARRKPFELRRRSISLESGPDHVAAFAAGASRLVEH